MESRSIKKVRRWAPRMWVGMNFSGWMRLLVRNRFDVSPPHFYMVPIISISTLFNSCLRYIKDLVYGRRIAKIQIKEPPIFILGHWRTGTTLLHELLSLDEQYTFPNYYQCYSPNHFLLTESLYTRMFGFLLPTHRPMDNMTASWEKPQEDEFALCNLGVPSPYLTMAFPNRPPQYPEYLTLEKLSSDELSKWKRTFIRFLKEIILKNNKRIILKSPQHTSRVKVLLELFPEAHFVHIVRNPYVVFQSTVHFLKAWYMAHGLQRPNFDGLEDYVFETFTRMYEKLEKEKPLISSSRFYELKYEDLVRDPVNQIKMLYERLNLGNFDTIIPALKKYLEGVEDYQTNRYKELSPETRDEITRRWGPIIQKYGYSYPHPTTEVFGERDKKPV